MTLKEFIEKWANTELGESQGYHLHFIDVCRLVGHEPPGGDKTTADGETFIFQQSLKKGSGGHGFADVYYENHFAIEYKSPDKYKDLNAAYQQLLQYRENLSNPPLLVVTDINHWEIHSNFPNTQKRIYRFTHSEIAGNPEVLGWLRDMFHAPERLHPRRNSEQVTKEAAQVFRLIADNMRQWEAEPRRIAYFLTKLVFCLFAEDVGLLPTAVHSPQGIFTHIIEQARSKPAVFRQYVQNLFVAMNEGGNILMRDIPYFNGTLFNVVTVEELSVEALVALEKAAKLNWEAIEPSIFGTLFERSLDPNKRSQLGAHYTSREDILLIVEPVLMQPLRYEWDTVQLEAQPARQRYDKAQTGRARSAAINQLVALRERILTRIRGNTVLDPACGSGNFLYVSLQLLMDLEKEVIQHPLWAGLQMPTPEVHPRQMYGIEIDPIAHALASIVVWIGYIQWRQNNGYGQSFKEPILEQLENNIVCKDAILPPTAPHPRGPKMKEGEDCHAKWDIPPELGRRMQAVARDLRKDPTDAENKLWQAIRKRQVLGRKFRRQVAIGAFVVDFYCSSERLAIEVDGPIHQQQQEADRLRQELIESLGIRFVRLSNDDVENRLEDAIEKIREVFSPHPRGPKMREGEPGIGVLEKSDESAVAKSSDAEKSKRTLDKSDESPSLLVGEGFGVGGDWPAVDVIVGNPPFLGGSKLRGELGDYYYERLTDFYAGRLPGFADLVCYWFEKAREQIENGKAKRAGLLATNSIRGGANREVLKRIKESGDIFMAWSDREWILDGAAVRVSMVGFDNALQGNKVLDGLPVRQINSDLSSAIDITGAQLLLENETISFMGPSAKGPFDIDEPLAKSMIAHEHNNVEVVRPVWSATDLVRQTRNKWTIDFGMMSEDEAKRFQLPYAYVKTTVYPIRSQNRRRAYAINWWRYAEPRPGMRSALSDIRRFIATPGVAKHRVFVWAEARILCNQGTLVFARDDEYFFGVLHSKLHEVWSLRMGTWLGKGNDPRYTPTTTFETFPFPWSLGSEDTSHLAHFQISRAAKQLHEERAAWLNPEGLSEKQLKDRTLTNLYNALGVYRGLDNIKVKPAAADFAPRLDELHWALDQAVCDAYGWEYAILEDEEEILRRLLALNLERAE